MSRKIKIILLSFLLGMNLGLASNRFSAADAQKFMEDLKQEMAAYKAEKENKLDLKVIQQNLYKELDNYQKQEKLTTKEVEKIRKDYETFLSRKNSPEKFEEEFYKFMEAEFLEVNKYPIVKMKEKQICNIWSCEEGLVCALDPKQLDGKSCKSKGSECSADKDCCSASCVSSDLKSGKKVCEELYRCFAPLELGKSCLENPVCREGKCLPINLETSGIGECNKNGRACNKNSECCSDSCEKGKCIESYICKDCIREGGKASRGQKCCEGLYLNGSGTCSPDFPPIIPPQVNIKFKIINLLTSFFINSAEAQADNEGITEHINANAEEMQYFKVKKLTEKEVALKTPAMSFTRKSDFNTCDVKVRDDRALFLNTPQPALNNATPMDFEIALLAFDYMFLGEGVNDYWTLDRSKPQTSIYGRLKSVAIKHAENRVKATEQINLQQFKLTCLCLDATGYANIKDEAKKTFFREKCPQYAEVLKAMNNSTDQLQGEASGVKGKALLAEVTKNLQEFNAALAVDDTEIYKGIFEVSEWAESTAQWNQAVERRIPLFKFTINGGAVAIGVLWGALLAGGVLAVLGGFSATSILSAWGAAGIIAAAGAAGGTGVYLIASLKGAWSSMRPGITDEFVSTYQCGKDQQCTDYNRVLIQPYNEICDIHTAANACIKNFLVYYESDEPRYLVDPWIPKGVTRSFVLRDLGESKNYAEKLEDGYRAARDDMKSKAPGGRVGTGFMSTLFIDPAILGKYAPNIGQDADRYIINEKIVDEIKAKAKKFAVEELLFLETDTENLNKFAEYVYQYHFLFPKTSKRQEISYPPVGLSTYLQVMSVGTAAFSAAASTNAAISLGNLNQKRIIDYIKTLKIYRASLPPRTGASQAILSKINETEKKISDAEAELENQKVFNSFLTDLSRDFNNAEAVRLVAKSLGARSDVSLSTGQTKFLSAIKAQRNIRKKQLEKLNVFKKAASASGNDDRANKMAAVSKKFIGDFTRPSSAGGAGGLDLGVSDTKGGNDKNKAASFEPHPNSDDRDYNNFGQDSGASRKRPSFTGAGGNQSDSENNAKASGRRNVSNGDYQQLMDAIAARNREGMDRYQSNNTQTLFEKITNAYIRNYEKVLFDKN